MESTDGAYVGGEVTTLSAKVAGFIQTVTVADNQSVKTGDLLLKLEDRDYRAQLARAEASVAAQRSALANIDANRRMHEAVIEQASAAKESQLAHIRAGQPVEIVADVLPGVSFVAASQASRLPLVRGSASSRRRMQPGISPRLSSGCRCASNSKTMALNSANCGQASRSRFVWTGVTTARSTAARQ